MSLANKPFKELDAEKYEEFREIKRRIVGQLEELLRDKPDRLALERDVRSHFSIPYNSRISKSRWEGIRRAILHSGKFKLLRATIGASERGGGKPMQANVLKLIDSPAPAPGSTEPASAASAQNAVDEEEEEEDGGAATATAMSDDEAGADGETTGLGTVAGASLSSTNN